MFNVQNRSEEAWGPLAKYNDADFFQLINCRRVASTKERIKNHIKKAKKLKTYKVSFKKEWHSDQFEIEAESDWEIGSAAACHRKVERSVSAVRRRWHAAPDYRSQEVNMRGETEVSPL